MSQNEIITDDGAKANNKYNCIICPKCKENARILIKNYKFGIYECKNGHSLNDILINNFIKTQFINKGEIICNNCNKLNNNTSYNNIYLCLKCNRNLCESCKSMHEKTHNIINYQEKYFICDLHFEPYNAYCLKCKKDLCPQCKSEHKEHNIIFYEKMISEISKEQNGMNIFYEKKERLKNDIKNLINKFESLINSIDNYFDIYENIIINNNNGNNYQNYYLLQNIKDLNNFKDSFISDINEIIDENNIFDKATNILELYNRINLPDDIYYKSENFNDKKYDINNIDVPNFEDIKEKSEIKIDQNLDTDDAFIMKTTEIHSDYMFISEKNEDNNYTDFDIKKMQKLLTMKNEKLIFSKIYILKDGRIIIHNEVNKNNNIFLCFIFDLKSDKCFNINLKDIKEIYEMNDGLILVATNQELMLIEIKQRNYEIIQQLKTEFVLIVKLKNEKILAITEKNLENIFIYKNKNLVLEKQIKLKSIKVKSIIWDYFIINENEIAIYTQWFDFFYGYRKRRINFIDIEKDKRIEYYDFIFSVPFSIDSLNEKYLIGGNSVEIFAIDLKNHSKIGKKFLSHEQGPIHSVLCLNKTQFIVCQYECIHQYEFTNDSKFKLISTVEFATAHIYKYPKRRFLIVTEKDQPKILFLYC